MFCCIYLNLIPANCARYLTTFAIMLSRSRPQECGALGIFSIENVKKMSTNTVAEGEKKHPSAGLRLLLERAGSYFIKVAQRPTKQAASHKWCSHYNQKKTKRSLRCWVVRSFSPGLFINTAHCHSFPRKTFF